MTDDWAGYGPATYGDRIARAYDLLHGGVLDTTGTVERLAELAGRAVHGRQRPPCLDLRAARIGARAGEE